jgi:hypothetical protein
VPSEEPYTTGPSWPPVGPPPSDVSDADQVAQARAQGHDLVGLSVDEAVSLATSNGFAVRLAREDGTDFALSMDLNFRRINLDVVDGRVVSTSPG